MQGYPQALLPGKDYKIKITLSDSDVNSLHLIRRSLVGVEDTVNDLGSVRSHAFIEPGKEHHFFSLSCNLYGIFQYSDLQYSLTDKEHGGAYWCDKNKLMDCSDVKCDILENCCAIFLPIAAVHFQPFQYQKPKPNNKGYTPFTGQCQAVHMPLEANYWHFEIHVFEPEGTRISANTSKWKLLAATSFFESYLKVHLSVVFPDLQLLKESLYKDKVDEA